MMDDVLPTHVWDREGKKRGDVINFEDHPCRLEGCRGNRIPVRWPNGQITRPCTEGMEQRPDGDWQIA